MSCDYDIMVEVVLRCANACLLCYQTNNKKQQQTNINNVLMFVCCCCFLLLVFSFAVPFERIKMYILVEAIFNNVGAMFKAA